MGSDKAAQASTEFFLVILFALVLITPVVIYFINESPSAVSDVNNAKVAQIARRLASTAETVYAFGEPTTLTVEVYMPEGVDAVYLNNTELSFVVRSSWKPLTISEGLSMNVTGNIKNYAGVHKISVQAANNSVVMSEISR